MRQGNSLVCWSSVIWTNVAGDSLSAIRVLSRGTDAYILGNGRTSVHLRIARRPSPGELHWLGIKTITRAQLKKPRLQLRRLLRHGHPDTVKEDLTVAPTPTRHQRHRHLPRGFVIPRYHRRARCHRCHHSAGSPVNIRTCPARYHPIYAMTYLHPAQDHLPRYLHRPDPRSARSIDPRWHLIQRPTAHRQP